MDLCRLQKRGSHGRQIHIDYDEHWEEYLEDEEESDDDYYQEDEEESGDD